MLKNLILLMSTLIYLSACSTANHNVSTKYRTEDINYQDGYILLMASRTKPQIYLLHNTSRRSIIIDHPVAHPSASAGWASKIDSNRWSAFMTNRRLFKLSCAVIYPKYKFKKIECANNVKVYSLKKFSMPRKLLGGSFWLAENKTHENLLQRLKNRNK